MVQELRLAPQMIQAMEILQLPTVELRERILQELQENPVLEVGAFQTEERVEPDASQNGQDRDEDFSSSADWQADWSDFLRRTRRPMASQEGDAKLEALQNTADRPQSLQDHLFEQFNLMDLPAEVRRIGEQIIYNIDDGGYLSGPLEEVVVSVDPKPAAEEMLRALRVVQCLDPPGVGARDLRECLLLQIEHGSWEEDGSDLARMLILNHLDDLQHNRYPKIARLTGRTVEEIAAAAKAVSVLNPRPGASFGGEVARRIMPDVLLIEVDGRYEVQLQNGYVPEVYIGDWYRRQLQESRGDPNLKMYLKKKIDAARWLIDAVRQRQDTLLRVSQTVFEFQKGFLDEGVEKLVPLRMQTVADRVGVHISTVSRAVADKHVQTPRGIFPLKYFFAGGTVGTDGEVECWETIRRKVEDLVAAEDKKGPLSDEAIQQALARQGIDIARRTVAKYRKVLGIPSARQRKQY
jgi:RNA polymerase sigma-54 factor